MRRVGILALVFLTAKVVAFVPRPITSKPMPTIAIPIPRDPLPHPPDFEGVLDVHRKAVDGLLWDPTLGVEDGNFPDLYLNCLIVDTGVADPTMSALGKMSRQLTDFVSDDHIPEMLEMSLRERVHYNLLQMGVNADVVHRYYMKNYIVLKIIIKGVDTAKVQDQISVELLEEYVNQAARIPEIRVLHSMGVHATIVVNSELTQPDFHYTWLKAHKEKEEAERKKKKVEDAMEKLKQRVKAKLDTEAK